MKNLLIAFASIGIVAIGAYAAAPAGGGGGTRPPEEGGVSAHAATHANGAADEVSVTGLSGVLGDDQSCDELRTATTQVNIGASAAPGVGDVLTATAADAATWQAAAGGCGGATSCDMNDDVATNYGAASDMACTWNTGITPDSWTCVAVADNAAIGIGYNIGATELTTDAIAIGNGANCDGVSCIAIGDGATVSAVTPAIAIGPGATATGASSISIGSDTAATNAVSITHGSTYGAQGVNSVAIGYSADVISTATSAIAIGQNASAINSNSDYCTVVGYSASCIVDSGVAIGRSASAASGTGSVAIGYSASASRPNVFVMGGTSVDLDTLHNGHEQYDLYETMTNGGSTNLTNIATGNNSYTGGLLHYTIRAQDGTDFQALAGTLTWAMVSKGNVETCVFTKSADETLAASAGTLTVAFTFTAGAGCMFAATPTSSLTTTLLRLHFWLDVNDTSTTITDQ